ncbi:MAG: DUF882 domain-containing protein [bacterium]|nr:DUF882 domain-containing protein [bacterium]
MRRHHADHDPRRRSFLGLCGRIALCGALPVPLLADRATAALDPRTRSLDLLNTHTGEALSCVYQEDGLLLPDALAALDRILRDHRTDEIKSMDPALLNLMSDVAHNCNASSPIHVVSGYRSPATNAALRSRNGGVARRSYHMEGKAVDLRLPGVSTEVVRSVASGVRQGGVGHYPQSDFVHVDTGPVRYW